MWCHWKVPFEFFTRNWKVWVILISTENLYSHSSSSISTLQFLALTIRMLVSFTGNALTSDSTKGSWRNDIMKWWLMMIGIFPSISKLLTDFGLCHLISNMLDHELAVCHSEANDSASLGLISMLPPLASTWSIFNSPEWTAAPLDTAMTATTKVSPVKAGLEELKMRSTWGSDFLI